MFDRIALEHALAEIDALTIDIANLNMEATGSNDPAAFVQVITAVLEAERDVALRLVALERAKQRLEAALEAREASPATA